MIWTFTKITEVTLLKVFKLLCGEPHQAIQDSKETPEPSNLNILALSQESSAELNNTITTRTDRRLNNMKKGSKSKRVYSERKAIKGKKIEPRRISGSSSDRKISLNEHKSDLNHYNEICGYINKCKVKDLMALENFDIETVIQIFDERKIKKFSSISDLTNRVDVIKKSHINSIAKHIGL